jgi:hypothetical protein
MSAREAGRVCRLSQCPETLQVPSAGKASGNIRKNVFMLIVKRIQTETSQNYWVKRILASLIIRPKEKLSGHSVVLMVGIGAA